MMLAETKLFGFMLALLLPSIQPLPAANTLPPLYVMRPPTHGFAVSAIGANWLYDPIAFKSPLPTLATVVSMTAPVAVAAHPPLARVNVLELVAFPMQ